MSAKEKVAAICLVMPVWSMWLPYITTGQTFNVNGFPFIWTYIFYIVYYILTPKRRLYNYLHWIKRLFLIMVIMAPLSLLIFDHGNYVSELFLNSFFLFIILLVFVTRPPTEEQLNFLKGIIIFTYLFIEVQAILSTLGIWQYKEVDLLDNTMTFFRAQTRVGDSNQTCLLLFLLSVMITGYYLKNKVLNMVIIIVTFATISMCASRGSFLSISVFMIAYLLTKTKKGGLKNFFFVLLFGLILTRIIVEYNVMGDIIQRSVDLSAQNDFTAGRDKRVNYVIKTSFNDSPVIGVGPGRVYPTTHPLASKEANGFNYSKYLAAPHNVWAVTLGEFGIIGFVCLLLVTILIIRRLDYKNPISWAVLVFFIINMNTEAIIIHGEVLFFACLMITIALSANQQLEIKGPLRRIIQSLDV